MERTSLDRILMAVYSVFVPVSVCRFERYILNAT
jgi:hypothetical protein